MTTNAVTDLHKTAAPTIRQLSKQSFQETQTNSIPVHLSVKPKPVEPVECMTHTRSLKENHVYFQINVEIPAKSTILVSVCFKSSSKSRYFLFNPNIKLAQFNIIVTTGDIRRKQTTLPITNVHSKPVYLKKGTNLGIIDPDIRIESKPSSITKNSVTPVNSENSKASTNPKTPISFDIDPEFPKEAKKMLQSVLTRFEHCFINKVEEVRIMRHVPKIKIEIR